MIWHSWHDFMLMGGYGFYVWGSVSLTFLLIIFENLSVIYRQRQILRSISKRIKSAHRIESDYEIKA